MNEFGKGKAYYQSFRDTGEFKDYVLHDIINNCGIYKEFKNLPEKGTVHTREDDENAYVFVENYSETEKTVELDGEYFDVINDKIISSVTVNPLSVAVLRRKK